MVVHSSTALCSLFCSPSTLCIFFFTSSALSINFLACVMYGSLMSSVS